MNNISNITHVILVQCHVILSLAEIIFICLIMVKLDFLKP